jgi:hypothetical protein
VFFGAGVYSTQPWVHVRCGLIGAAAAAVLSAMATATAALSSATPFAFGTIDYCAGRGARTLYTPLVYLSASLLPGRPGGGVERVRERAEYGHHNVIPGSAKMHTGTCFQHLFWFADTQCGNAENYRECSKEF